MINWDLVNNPEKLAEIKAEQDRIKAYQTEKADDVKAFNERGAQSSNSLIDPRLQQQQSLLARALQSGFNEQRGAISTAAQQAGGRRSTSYSNALGGQFGREQSTMQRMISDTLGKQIGLDEAQRGREFTGEQNELQRALSREQFNKKMELAEEELDFNKYNADRQFGIDVAKKIGSFGLF